MLLDFLYTEATHPPPPPHPLIYFNRLADESQWQTSNQGHARSFMWKRSRYRHMGSGQKLPLVLFNSHVCEQLLQLWSMNQRPHCCLLRQIRSVALTGAALRRCCGRAQLKYRHPQPAISLTLADFLLLIFLFNSTLFGLLTSCFFPPSTVW